MGDSELTSLAHCSASAGQVAAGPGVVVMLYWGGNFASAAKKTVF